MVFLTGDTHGGFKRIALFCSRMKTTKDDIMIILGDAGINFYYKPNKKYHTDWLTKRTISDIPITLFCIHGNHEQRPANLPNYHLIDFHGGKAWIEDDFPNIIFAKDGEIYDFDGNKCIAMGGAYSIDKEYRIPLGAWWPDEQPSKEIKEYVEKQLDKAKWKVDCVFSHTVPLKYEPTEVFFKGVDQSKVDKSTEKWLDSIENKLDYEHWYAGHYHTEKAIDKLTIMFEDYQCLEPKAKKTSKKVKETHENVKAVETPASEQSSETEEPKKRGRKPKTNETTEATNAAEASKESSPAPKKRGRKPKLVNESFFNNLPEPLKKRGRKPKTKE